MSRMMMNDFYQELEKIGVYFEEGDEYAEYVRYGGNDDFGCYGTLGNNKKGDGVFARAVGTDSFDCESE